MRGHESNLDLSVSNESLNIRDKDLVVGKAYGKFNNVRNDIRNGIQFHCVRSTGSFPRM